MNPKKLEDKVAIVTGAAGQLGRQFVGTLRSQGAHIVAVDIDDDRLASAYDGLAEVRTMALDITDQGDVKAKFRSVQDQLGSIDVLVNNAGIAVFTPFEERTLEDFMRVLRVNLGGTFNCSQAAVSTMKAQPSGGCIINIGSVYGVVSGDPRIYTDCDRNTSEVYGASKAGVIQMTRYLAAHLAPYKIRVNSISPGGVHNDQGEDFVRRYSDRTPMGRMAAEDEMSGALLFLATDQSAYMTGQNLVVDGGLTAW